MQIKEHIGTISFIFWEFWLGRTKVVKANSTIELILNITSSVWGFFTKGFKMLDGKEVEGKIGNVGEYSLDVDTKGIIKIEAGVKKEIEGAVVSNKLEIEVSLFTILEKVVAKTPATWDDKLVAEIKLLLGLAA